jgi:hypothetical protein
VHLRVFNCAPVSKHSVLDISCTNQRARESVLTRVVVRPHDVAKSPQAMSVLGSKSAISRRWLAEVEPVLEQRDRTNVILIGVLQFFFYFVPLHCFAVWEWLCRLAWGRRGALGNASDWSALMLGGYLQGVFVHTMMAITTYVPPHLCPTSPAPQLPSLACLLSQACSHTRAHHITSHHIASHHITSQFRYGGPGQLSVRFDAPELYIAACTLAAAALQLAAFIHVDPHV